VWGDDPRLAAKDREIAELNEALAACRAEAGGEIDHLTDAVGAIEAALGVERTDVGGYDVQASLDAIAALREQVTEWRDSKEVVDGEVAALRAEVERLKQVLSDAKTKPRDEILADAYAQIDRLHYDIGGLHEARNEGVKKIERLEKEAERPAELVKVIDRGRTKAEAEVARLRRERDEWKRVRDTEVDAVQGDYEAMKSRAERAEAALREIEECAMLATDASQVDGVRGEWLRKKVAAALAPAKGGDDAG
jgi:chromosome segregation ATPase